MKNFTYLILTSLLLLQAPVFAKLADAEEVTFLNTLITQVPLPSVKSLFFRTEESSPPTNSELLKKLDSYFDEAISCYDPEIQSILKKAYYSNEILEEVVDLQKKTGNFAELTNFVTDNAAQPIQFKMRVDASIPSNSLFRRISMIHEIAAHMGQRLEWGKKSGISHYKENSRRPGLHAFLELTAFNLEKTIVDSMPTNAVENDINTYITDARVKQRALRKYLLMRETPSHDIGYQRWKLGYARKYGDNLVTSESSKQFQEAYTAQAASRILK